MEFLGVASWVILWLGAKYGSIIRGGGGLSSLNAVISFLTPKVP